MRCLIWNPLYNLKNVITLSLEGLPDYVVPPPPLMDHADKQ